jgi:hypothetical protein
MKHLFSSLAQVLIIGSCFLIFSSQQKSLEIQKAMKYLDVKEEVRLKFIIESRLEVVQLSRFVSVDNVIDNHEVFAYANREQFNKLLEYGFDFEVPASLNDPPEGVVTGGYAECIKNNLPYEWDEYPTLDEYYDMMNKFASDYPALCKIEEFGTSVRGRKLLAAKVSDNVSETEAEPKFFYQSTIHGDEICGYVLMLRLIDHLCSNYSNARIKRLIDSVEIWINPCGNPDGTYYSSNTSTSGSRRNNANNVDLNRAFTCPTGNPMASSQKENKIIEDFCIEKGFTLEASFHGGAELAPRQLFYPAGRVYKCLSMV